MIPYVPFLCRIGLHRYRREFVGSSWNPLLYVHACTRCGREGGR